MYPPTVCNCITYCEGVYSTASVPTRGAFPGAPLVGPFPQAFCDHSIIWSNNVGPRVISLRLYHAIWCVFSTVSHVETCPTATFVGDVQSTFLLESLSHGRWCLIPVPLVYWYRHRRVLGLGTSIKMVQQKRDRPVLIAPTSVFTPHTLNNLYYSLLGANNIDMQCVLFY